MDVLSEIYTRWYGSAIGVTHNDVRNMCDIILSKKSSFTRYKRELNDKIFFDTYGEHLYKNMEGKRKSFLIRESQLRNMYKTMQNFENSTFSNIAVKIVPVKSLQ